MKWGNLINGKVQSLLSKTLGGTVAAEVLVAGTETAIPSGAITIVYVAVQKLYDGWTYYVDRRFPAED